MERTSSANQTNNSLEPSSARDFLRILLQRKWWFIGTFIVVVGLAITYITLATPLYRAETLLLRQTTNFDQALFQTQVFEFTDPQRDLQTGADLVKLDVVAAMAKEKLGTSRSVRQLSSMVQVTPNGATDIIAVTATGPNPEEAAQVSDAFADEFITYRREADRSIIGGARQKLLDQLSAMTEEEKTSDQGKILVQRAEDLGILESMQTGGYEVVQRASVPTTTAAPRTVFITGLSVIIGLVAGLALAFAVHFLNRRIRDEDTLEAEFGSPVLASVPVMGRRWRRRELGLPEGVVGFPDARSPLLEPFRHLRSNLKYFGIDRRMESILITSGMPQEGKTVTSINLALSLALSGTRVILIEADLRRPRLHSYLGLDNKVGLSNILVGTHSFADVAQVVKLEKYVAREILGKPGAPDEATLRKNLLCITSGPLPPNPAELLESQRMVNLIKEASSVTEYLLIDSPPLLLVSDALSLVPHVDGVIVSTRINGTRLDEARAVRTLLDRSGANLIGVVAGGVKRKKKFYRGYEYGYYSAATRS